MRAAKVDANHAEIVAALRKAGATVQSLAAVGNGVPDLLVGIRGRLMLMEVKDGNKVKSAQKLTTAQERWHTIWAGYPLSVVDGVDAALRALGVLDRSVE